MAKLLKSILALGIAALLVFALAACKGNDKPTEAPTTDPIIDETTTEQPTVDVIGTGDEDPTTEPTTDEAIDPTTVDPSATTDPNTPTTEAVTTTIPKTKEEIVTYYNAAVQKVKTDKPGYVKNDRTLVDEERIWISSKLLDAVAPGILKLVKNSFSGWSDDSVKAKGSDHNGFPPTVDINPNWIKSATCTESGNNYVIRINLNEERVPTLPTDNKTTTIGKIMDNGVHTTGSIKDGAADVGVDISKWDAKYSGYINATINKNTGAIVQAFYYVDCLADVTVKVPLIPAQDATVPLATETRYTFNQ